MWIVAGLLLGVVVLASVVGFHSGPHTHVAAGVVGVLAAAWLVLMAASGRSAPFVWALLTADLVVSAGVGIMAWRGLADRGLTVPHPSRTSLEGVRGVALSDLKPEGIVSVRGEHWSAVAVNGTVPAGTGVQVLKVEGVHLEVWGEREEAVPPSSRFQLKEAEHKEHNQ